MSFFGLQQGSAGWFVRLLAVAFMFYVLLTTYQQVQAWEESKADAELKALDESIDPVRLLVFDQRTCLPGGAFVVAGFLDKTQYPDGSEATFKGLQVYDTATIPNRIPWRRTSETDMSAESRPYGEQSIDFVIEGPCDVTFTVLTEHESPLTGRKISMRWGPFYSVDDP